MIKETQISGKHRKHSWPRHRRFRCN